MTYANELGKGLRGDANDEQQRAEETREWQRLI